MRPPINQTNLQPIHTGIEGSNVYLIGTISIEQNGQVFLKMENSKYPLALSPEDGLKLKAKQVVIQGVWHNGKVKLNRPPHALKERNAKAQVVPEFDCSNQNLPSIVANLVEKFQMPSHKQIECKQCGSSISIDSNFCLECGEENQ